MKPDFPALLGLFLILLAWPAQAATPGDTAKAPDSPRHVLDLFVQPGVQFLGFDDRERYQTVLDTQYARYRSAGGEDSAKVTKQDFQKVNFCFPISFGMQWFLNDWHALALGAGYFHDREAVVISESDGTLHEYYYALQGVPAYLEYRLAISPHLLTLKESEQFSLIARWYWMLPGTEIYSSWGQASARSDIMGNGWGVALGYRVGTWKRFSLFADIGYSSIKVSSDSPWSKVIPDTTGNKAGWDLGGLQLQFRGSFGALQR